MARKGDRYYLASRKMWQKNSYRTVAYFLYEDLNRLVAKFKAGDIPRSKLRKLVALLNE